ncbi:ATP-binding protein [Roseovarius sp. D22-M7]|uniref:ATP-binding protein n=1 Tax=Roseovarius sp. D22-M7 TaxID=3127116 RepID=UPI00300FEC59
MTFTCDATALDVRRMLAELQECLAVETIADDDRGTVDIALAEALNNIVEHAYHPDTPGTITLTLWIGPTRVSCELRDKGVALPGLEPPHAAAPDVTGPRETLPEGGFGWSIIHALTARLCYLRDGAENRLILDFDIASS